MEGPSKLEEAMEKAARQVTFSHVRDGQLVGLGSGSAVSRFAKALGERVRREKLGIQVVPSSMQAWSLARENGLKLHEDSAHCPPALDVAIDGADQVARKSRAMIKGGGGALLREKIILSSSKESFILIDSSKLTDVFTRSVPVEVVQFALDAVSTKLKLAFGTEPRLRTLEKGYSFFTESGNVILDCKLPDMRDPLKLEFSIKSMPGVVEVGLFNCKVQKFYVGKADGSFESM